MARPSWADGLPWALIQQAAAKHGVNPLLLAAFVWQESKGDGYRNRTEPAWKSFLTPEHFAAQNLQSVVTEEANQAMSWGLVQVMGAVARELGFTGPLPLLCRPDVGLDYGAKKLRALLTKYPDLRDAIAAYNAGSPRKLKTGRYVNQDYVDDVMNYFAALGQPTS